MHKLLKMSKDIKTLFDKHKGYLTKNQIPDRKTYAQILKMVESGKIERLKRGVYSLQNKMSDVMIDVDKIVPNGVLCMFSAWFHYQITTQIPQSFNIAIEKNRKVVTPDYPPITLYYWKKNYQELGVVSQNINGYMVNIYDLEKSVCDAVKFRNKIGIETTAEIIRNYLVHKERNFIKLMHYAKIMRIEKTMKSYIEIQL